MAVEANSDKFFNVKAIFNDKGNILAQKSAQFRNKSQDFEHSLKMELSNNNIGQIGKYVSLCKQINFITSFGETDEKRNRDYNAIKLLCKIILSVNKNLKGFEKIYDKAEIINHNIPVIYNELISNAQKAVCENLMKDPTIKNNIVLKTQETKLLNLLRDQGVGEEKINILKNNKPQMSRLLLQNKSQINIDDIDWYTDLEAREEIIKEAIARDIHVIFFIRYIPHFFEIGAKNKAYVAPILLKGLNDRLNAPIRRGEDLVKAFEKSTSNIGAGLGIDLTKICIENIEEECDVKANARYENDSKGMLIMTISFNLG